MKYNNMLNFYIAIIISGFFIFFSFNYSIILAQSDILKKSSKNNFLDENYLYQTDSSPFGTSYAEWSKKWWQWYTSIPTTENPNYIAQLDQQEINWNIGQDSNSPVFFLFQRNTDYPSIADGNNWTVTVPKGKAVFAQIASGQYDYGDPQTNPSLDQKITPEMDAELKKVIQSNDNAHIKVVLDDEPIFYIGITDESEKMKYRTQSGFFNITLPENNIWNEIPGVYRAFAEGYYIMIKPLPVGIHKLVYEVSVMANTNKYSQEMIYNILVK